MANRPAASIAIHNRFICTPSSCFNHIDRGDRPRCDTPISFMQDSRARSCLNRWIETARSATSFIRKETLPVILGKPPADGFQDEAMSLGPPAPWGARGVGAISRMGLVDPYLRIGLQMRRSRSQKGRGPDRLGEWRVQRDQLCSSPRALQRFRAITPCSTDQRRSKRPVKG